jgi:hypothetical protein
LKSAISSWASVEGPLFIAPARRGLFKSAKEQGPSRPSHCADRAAHQRPEALRRGPSALISGATKTEKAHRMVCGAGPDE